MAARRELEARQKRLEAEWSGIDATGRLLDARIEWANARVAAAQKRMEAATSARSLRLKKQAEAAGKQAERAEKGEDPEVARLAREVEALTAELAQAAEEQKEVERVLRVISEKRKRTEESAALIRSQAESADVGGLFAQALFEERVRIASSPQTDASDERLGESFDRIGLRAYRIAAARRAIADQEAEEGAAKPSPEAAELEERRRELLRRLDEGYSRITKHQAALGVEGQLFAEAAESYRRWLDTKLFSVKSLPMFGADSFGAAWTGFVSLVTTWREGEALAVTARAVREHRVAVAAAALGMLALIAFRPRMRRAIVASGEAIRSIKQDTFTQTLSALALTLLRAAPVPLLFILAGLLLGSAAEDSREAGAVGFGLQRVAAMFGALFFLWETLAPKGLGESHFRWNPAITGLIRRHAAWYIPVQVLFLLFVATIFGLWEIDRGVQEMGRLAYLASDGALLVCFATIFRPRGGIFDAAIRARPAGWLARLAGIWYPLVLALPGSMLAMAFAGHYFAALGLRERFAATARFALLSVVIYALVYRWMAIRHRRLALQQAVEERKEREDEEKGAGRPAGDLPEIEEPEIDLTRVGRQTVSLMRFLLFVVLASGIASIWSRIVPAFSGIGEGWTVGGLPVAGILSGALLAAVTAVTARNLPGLLEIALLQNLPIRQGTRYAISTLSQYAVVAAGTVATAGAVGLDPSKLGWIVAALSFGLGFGLQEIVANFVCGVILLFERPVRVGDVVTIGEVSGTVTRINIRATTLTDWDRREFIVPNKEFITGRLLNWTLTNTINRITLKVGIAYRSDLARAEAVLLGIVRETPGVLADPAPFVTLESFGDSALDLSLRVFLPHLDDRLKVIHRINGEIHRRFREEGIEIPFPQRDVRVRPEGG
jgi:potassium efflux system protein